MRAAVLITSWRQYARNVPGANGSAESIRFAGRSAAAGSGREARATLEAVGCSGLLCGTPPPEVPTEFRRIGRTDLIFVRVEPFGKSR